jgi:hypothetical protein
MPGTHFYIYFEFSKYYVHFKDQTMIFMLFNSKSISNKSSLIYSWNKIIFDLSLLVSYIFPRVKLSRKLGKA